MQKTAKKIVFANQKGGVGKTTAAFNVSSELVNRGYAVLGVDMDSQGNFTTYSGFKNAEHTIAQSMERVAFGKSPNEEIIVHTQEGFDLIPGDIETALFEANLINIKGRERILKDLLKPFESKYDYIIIDTMPSLGMMTINALNAADSVLIPIQAKQKIRKHLIKFAK